MESKRWNISIWFFFAAKLNQILLLNHFKSSFSINIHKKHSINLKFIQLVCSNDKIQAEI